ncbi:hypothetical protein PG991_006494 [Apiospora marii]|uniref:Uncharacterized protein n=1 Tax=Apiospora marii TaxID=335849 RepID=A0ABR1S0R3_9PEZI
MKFSLSIAAVMLILGASAMPYGRLWPIRQKPHTRRQHENTHLTNERKTVANVKRTCSFTVMAQLWI